jgi:reverse gyrase
MQSNFLENKTEENLAAPVAPQDVFDPEAYNTQRAAEEDNLDPADKKVLSRVDGVLSRYKELKNSDLKLVLKGITEKTKQRRAELDRLQKKKDKKEKTWKKEVEQAKNERKALEEKDQANW